MCVMSMVADHYRKTVPDLFPWLDGTYQPSTITVTTVPDVQKLERELKELRKVVEEMKEALAAAKKVDDLTNQPDCESDEKIKWIRQLCEFLKINPEDILPD